MKKKTDVVLLLILLSYPRQSKQNKFRLWSTLSHSYFTQVSGMVHSVLLALHVLLSVQQCMGAWEIGNTSQNKNSQAATFYLYQPEIRIFLWYRQNGAETFTSWPDHPTIQVKEGTTVNNLQHFIKREYGKTITTVKAITATGTKHMEDEYVLKKDEIIGVDFGDTSEITVYLYCRKNDSETFKQWQKHPSISIPKEDSVKEFRKLIEKDYKTSVSDVYYFGSSGSQVKLTDTSSLMVHIGDKELSIGVEFEMVVYLYYREDENKPDFKEYAPSSMELPAGNTVLELKTRLNGEKKQEVEKVYSLKLDHTVDQELGEDELLRNDMSIGLQIKAQPRRSLDRFFSFNQKSSSSREYQRSFSSPRKQIKTISIDIKQKE